MAIVVRAGRRAAKRAWIRIAAALLCMFCAGCAGAQKPVEVSFGEPVESVETADESGETDAPPVDGDPGEAVIYVHVCGAVMSPGVVRLAVGSRGQDALEAAGGFAPDAAETAVNLARTVEDGMQLYFPTREEAQAQRAKESEEASGKVNINTADVERLCTLPGIGEARAKAIVKYREANGRFREPEDVMRVSGIKESAFDKIRDLITVD